MINAACCVLKLRFLFSTNRRRHLTSSHQITRSPSDRKIVACLVKAVYNLCTSLICTSWLEYNKVWDITRSFGISRDIWQIGFDFWLLTFVIWHLIYNILHLTFEIWYITFYIWLLTFTLWHVLCYICHFNFDIWHLCFLIIYLSRFYHKSKSIIHADCLLKPNYLIRLHRCLSNDADCLSQLNHLSQQVSINQKPLHWSLPGCTGACEIFIHISIWEPI